MPNIMHRWGTIYAKGKFQSLADLYIFKQSDNEKKELKQSRNEFGLKWKWIIRTESEVKKFHSEEKKPNFIDELNIEIL